MINNCSKCLCVYYKHVAKVSFDQKRRHSRQFQVAEDQMTVKIRWKWNTNLHNETPGKTGAESEAKEKWKKNLITLQCYSFKAQLWPVSSRLELNHRTFWSTVKNNLVWTQRTRLDSVSRLSEKTLLRPRNLSQGQSSVEPDSVCSWTLTGSQWLDWTGWVVTPERKAAASGGVWLDGDSEAERQKKKIFDSNIWWSKSENNNISTHMVQAWNLEIKEKNWV